MKTPSDPKNDLWVFREGRKNVSTATLYRELADNISELLVQPIGTRLISALMRAGEFESGLTDANSAASFIAHQVTDVLADTYVAGPAALDSARKLLADIGPLPESISISPPEGFAYYALHPHDFVRLATRASIQGDSVLVIGIRSIGTTLSALVRAALEHQGKRTQRITARPTGHPYDRVVRFSPEQEANVREWNNRGAEFLVVDEGPGRSGSSFLSVAEALTGVGVSQERIMMLGSRGPDVNQLCAENARARWSRFRFLWPEPCVYTRFSNHTYVAGGNWRRLLLPDEDHWPPCWPQMERLKFLSPDRRWLFKFEGFGRFGEEVLSRAQILSDAGFGCSAEDGGDGMIRYPMIPGRPMRSIDVSTDILRHLARYCAVRASEFRALNQPSSQLPAMVGFNVMQEFGNDIGSEMQELDTPNPILADGRMEPHEWIRATDGRIIKVDACTHGDDHFFPGPCDIAWDLAGAIVEWNLDQNAAAFLLSEFRRISGLDRSRVIPLFVFANTIFRMGYWNMALSTVLATPEEQRVANAYHHYRNLADEHLRALKLVRVPGRTIAVDFPLDASTQPGTAA